MICIEALEKTYRSARRTVQVITGIDLAIPTGSFFTLLGPSGCGKTTTLRIVAGLEHHDRGRIWLGERLVSDPSQEFFVPANGRSIGMVFQSYAIWPHMDVFENVAYPLRQRHAGLSRAELGKRVAEALDLVGLKDLARVPSTALSGGQQQRVALARALVDRPDFLLLDEPLSNLDAQLRERMRTEIRDLQRRLGITTLYVTHDRAEALSMSTFVAVMNAGRIEMVGTPAEIYERPTTLFVAHFLGPCNLVAGRLVAHDAGAFLVQTAHGPLACEAPAGCAIGDAVDVVFRPEDVQLMPAPDGTTGPWHGRMTAATYLGDRLDCTVSLGGGVVRAFAHPSAAAFLDKPVKVALLEHRRWVVPRTAAGAA